MQDDVGMISGLGKRTFLLHSVHRGAPTLMTTRWVMSYLAGPMTLAQIRDLAPASAAPAPAPPAAASAPPTGVAAPPAAPAVAAATSPLSTAAPPAAAPAPATPAAARPLLPPDVRQFFVPPVARAEGWTYCPAVLVAAEARYAKARLGVDETRELRVLVPLVGGPIAFSPDRAELVDLPVELLEPEPVAGAAFAPLPPEAARARSYGNWSRELTRWIKAEQPIVLFESKETKLVSNVGESERDFRIRLAEHAREARDERADDVRERFDKRFRTLEDRLRRAEQAAARRAAQSQQAMLSTGVAVLGGLLGAMLGGGAKGQLGRASTAARGAGRVARTRQEAAMAGETVEAVRAHIDELERELEDELRELEDEAVAQAPLDEVAVRANLNAISLRLVALAWLPHGPGGPLWR
jgi:hypothetical protein